MVIGHPEFQNSPAFWGYEISPRCFPELFVSVWRVPPPSWGRGLTPRFECALNVNQLKKGFITGDRQRK